ncbi:class I SAM-dependent methyltransferase [Streptomyces sp. SID13031]|uniref:class I SAM-dependent DNA methyltransferase n=1 Tax=Streptomyces sp. SID13031 TaxID=2706046 RepID=UPI0013CDC624|nr:class I SAM-dependent methyltransferase [Streptomyces sp. SID13031]NEA30524.1 class I SAM-dependent methyltransferase [Streptomyces sp. SID13031]
MSEGYVEGFAQAYDQFWRPYPTKSAQSLLKLLESSAPDARRVLDIGCGTGIVAEQFQQAGFEVTGLDKSPAMLALARARLGEAPVLIEGDAADFTVDEQFPVAVSTYDIPNHLADLDQIAAYLQCVYAAVEPGGLFAFDLATVAGLRGMNTVQIRDTEEAMLLFRGALNESAGVGFYRISGVVRAEDGRYDRFETTMTNIVVPIDHLLKLLADAGWADSYLAAQDDLLTPLAEVPDTLRHVFVISRKP